MQKFGEVWGFHARISEKEGLYVILQRIGLKMQYLEVGYALGQALKTYGRQNAILKTLGSKMQFFQKNRVLGSLGMQVGDLHAIFQTWGG